MGKLLIGLSIVLALVAIAVLPNVHVGRMSEMAAYVEFGVPAVLLAMGLLHVKLDRIEKLLSDRKSTST